MSLDGTMLRNIAFELNDKLCGARIDKIYQTEKDELLIMLRNNRVNYKLLLSASSNNPRVYITDIKKETPVNAPIFSMILRKNLQGFKVNSIKQYEFDRILIITFKGFNDFNEECEKKLIIEIMGKYSNIILLDESNKIIDSIKHVTEEMSRVRQVLPNLSYSYPPNLDKLNPLKVERDIFLERLSEHENKLLYEFIQDNFMGISKQINQEILFLAEIDGNNIVKNIDVNQKNKLCDVFISFFSDIEKNIFLPCAYYDRDKLKYFSSLNLNIYQLFKREEYKSVSELLDKVYFCKDQQDRVKQKSILINHVVDTNLTRAKKKFQKQREELVESDEREDIKIKADLISANLYKIPKGCNEIILDNFYDNMNPLKIKLDPTLSANQYAQKLYKRYQKLKSRADYLKNEINKTTTEIAYLENVKDSIERTETVDDLKEIFNELHKNSYISKSKKDNKYRENNRININKITFLSYELYYGKNNLQNEYVSFKIASKDDLWFHVKNLPGSHVILKSSDNKFSDEAILTAAKLAAQNSKAKSENKVDVDYTFKKYVKKHPSGKPGLVNYTNFKTITVEIK